MEHTKILLIYLSRFVNIPVYIIWMVSLLPIHNEKFVIIKVPSMVNASNDGFSPWKSMWNFWWTE
jgi:hypothetical protein